MFHFAPESFESLTCSPGCTKSGNMSRKDTRRSLRATHQVEAGGDDVGRLAAVGQTLVERHPVEVERRVQTVLVHLQLVTQSVDVLLGCRHTNKQINNIIIHFTAAVDIYFDLI